MFDLPPSVFADLLQILHQLLLCRHTLRVHLIQLLVLFSLLHLLRPHPVDQSVRLLQSQSEVPLDGLVVSLLELQRHVHQRLELVLLHQRQSRLVRVAERERAHEALWMLLVCHAGLQVLDDVVGEHLEIKQEVLL